MFVTATLGGFAPPASVSITAGIIAGVLTRPRIDSSRNCIVESLHRSLRGYRRDAAVNPSRFHGTT
jgi:hypothetical protein